MKLGPLVPLVVLTGCVSVTPPEPVNATVGERQRARALGITIGSLPTGTHNAITDVPGVRVGHTTVHRGANVRTGVTVILPHGDNLYTRKVPAAVLTFNGYGKLVGSTQVDELGEIESPIALTNTLNVGRVMDALVGYMLEQNPRVRSVNVVVGETNDGRLNDIRGRHVTTDHVRAAIAGAKSGPVAEGCVGAGTGTMCFGYKGGIGTSSRKASGATVGVLVQTNYGGRLYIAGRRFARRRRDPAPEDGSCMIVVATDAALSPRNLKRLARRAIAGMARTGSSFSNGSGDYVVAFSTAKTNGATLGNDRVSPLFRAAADATEEAILNSLCMATDTTGNGRTVRALPLDDVKKLFSK